jgi:hypothetical protein
MIIGLSILGALLSVILLIYNARKNPSAIYLGLFFLLISLYGLIQYIVLYSQSVVWVAIVFANAGFPTYLMGPVLYLYVRSLLNDDPRLRKTDLLHLLPMLVYLALIFPYLITPWSFKLEVARHFIEKTSGIGSFNFNIASIYQYIPVSVVYLSRPVLITGYLIASVYLLLKFSLSGSSSPLFSQQRFIRKWLWILLGFILVLSVSHGLQVAITTF